MKEKNKNIGFSFLQAIGIFVFIAGIVMIFKAINKATSTKLYDPRALKELEEDPDLFDKVYRTNS